MDSSFGLHLVYEGRKRIRLHDLPVDHAQFRRCRKAAVQNIRSDFFKTAGIQGIAVNKVYKIENEFLLENFQEQTVAHPNGKIKGLFCNVDRKAIETMVVNGMHSELLHGAILEPNWFTIPNTDFKEKLHRQQDATFAKTRLQQSAPIAVFDMMLNDMLMLDSFRNNFQDTVRFQTMSRIKIKYPKFGF